MVGPRRVLCATPLQVGRDTQTLKEPVTRWHRAAWSHLYCRDAIVVLVPHSADSVVSFVASGIAGSSGPRQLLLPFRCVHMLPLIKLIKGKTDTFFFSCPLLHCALHSLFLLLLRIQCFGRPSELSLCAQGPMRPKTHRIESPWRVGS